MITPRNSFEACDIDLDSRAFSFTIEEAKLVALFRTLSPDARAGFLNGLRRLLWPDSRQHTAARPTARSNADLSLGEVTPA